MTKNTLYISGIAIIISTLAFITSMYNTYSAKTIVTVDIAKVFEEYNMKKDLEKRAASNMSIYSDKIDSLQAITQQMPNKIITAQMDSLKQTAIELYKYKDNEIKEQTWKRINACIGDFADKNKYDIIIGNNTLGSVLYAKKITDKTAEFVTYLNNNYQNE